jgi:hypothetical protein
MYPIRVLAQLACQTRDVSVITVWSFPAKVTCLTLTQIVWAHVHSDAGTASNEMSSVQTSVNYR